MRLYSIASPADLRIASSRKWQPRLQRAGERYVELAEGRVADEFLHLVMAACGKEVDHPATRIWVNTIEGLGYMRDGDELTPRAALMGHLTVDSPAIGRLFELLGWEIVAATFDGGLSRSVNLPAAPPEYLPVGRRGVFRVEPAWPTNCSWELCELNGRLVLRGAQASSWQAALVLDSPFIDALVPVDQPSLCHRDLEDFPIIQSRPYAQVWGAEVIRAAEILSSYCPPVGGLVRCLSSAILPLLCGDSMFGSASREQAMGLVFLPATDQFDQLVECLLHETAHQYLFRIEECGALFDQDSPEGEHFYSPWRTDARPLRMLLHGAFVFTAVADMYLWSEASEVLSLSQTECQRRAYRRKQQAAQALSTIQRHGRTARFGEVVVDALVADLSSIDMRCNLIPKECHDIDAQLAEHRQRYADYLD